MEALEGLKIGDRVFDVVRVFEPDVVKGVPILTMPPVYDSVDEFVRVVGGEIWKNGKRIR